MKVVERSIRFVPMIIVMGTIFFLSHQPDTSLQIPSLPGLDKLAHGIIYAALAAAVLYAVPGDIYHSRPRLTSISAVIFCILYGITDEYHQTFIPGRDASLGDIVADGMGAALLIFFWLRYQNHTGVHQPHTKQVKP